ncbi:VOC family protein [Nocardia alni]|uniref:VOC family protein n=1 Tax=Nocardia alni TaxID=2815723 RepID=UPI001C2260A6|nr:VOC family protein [Nocardia alni]
MSASVFRNVADIHWVFLCPPLHARGSLSGQTRYRDVPDGMIGLGWYTDDAVELFHRLAAAGIRAHDQQGNPITDAAPPRSSFASDVRFTEPADTGIRYEFQETGKRHWAKYGQEADPRLRADWAGPVPDPADPLGLHYTSHHTVLTRDPARVLRLYTELLDGEIIGEGDNAELGAASTFVRLGDTVLEIAVTAGPGPETANGRDHYRGVTYVVDDRDRVRTHLATVAVPTQDTAHATVIPPEHGFGAEWCFVHEPPYPPDARRQARLV